MDDKGLGTIAIVLLSLGGLLVAGAAAGGIMYMTDQAIGATIVDKSCSSLPTGKTSQVTVETKFPVPGIEHTLKEFDNGICKSLRPGEDGNYAEYHLQSGRTIFYEREGGKCLYDSDGVICD